MSQTVIKGIVTDVKRTDADRGSVFAAIRYEADFGLVPKPSAFNAKYLGIKKGDFVELSGVWRPSSNPRFPDDVFRADAVRPSMPGAPDSAKAWLLGIFDDVNHGVTPSSVDAFLKAQGVTGLAACERNVEAILGVSRDPASFRSAILREWARRISGRRAVQLLEASGVDSKSISLALSEHRDAVWDIISRNPYTLARTPKFGFKNADLIGTSMGIAAIDDRRVLAAFQECVMQARSKGDTYVCVDEVGEQLKAQFGVPQESAIDFARRHLSDPTVPFAFDVLQGQVVVSDRDILDGERRVSRLVVEMIQRGRGDPDGHDIATKALASRKKFECFDEIQRSGVALATAERFAIVTGGPGTGKSALTEAIVVAGEMKGRRIVLAAPTGKAAKRSEEATGRDASTVHRLLDYGPDARGNMTFRRNASNPLPANTFVIVDEASMLDIPTARALLEAIPGDGGLLLVGDEGQLPSVDAGAVLRDLLAARDASGQPLVPRVSLKNVYRQGRDSAIAMGAARIRGGEMPAMTNRFVDGLLFQEHHSSEVVDRIVALVEKTFLAQGYRAEHIAVVSPQAPGNAGTTELNARLSQVFNPNGRPVSDERVPGVPRIGDRVMVSENDTETGVANGEVGEIRSVQKGRGRGSTTTMTIRFDDGREVNVPAAAWRQYPLAYAITAHKSQGSQYEVVIMPAVREHVHMLDRSLFYTGWTRAQKFLVVVGEREVVESAIGKIRPRTTRAEAFVTQACADLGVAPYRAPIVGAVPKSPTVAKVPASGPSFRSPSMLARRPPIVDREAPATKPTIVDPVALRRPRRLPIAPVTGAEKADDMVGVVEEASKIAAQPSGIRDPMRLMRRRPAMPVLDEPDEPGETMICAPRLPSPI